jgi:hypothetical protein
LTQLTTKLPIVIAALCGAVAWHAPQTGQVPYAVIHNAISRHHVASTGKGNG